MVRIPSVRISLGAIAPPDHRHVGFEIAAELRVAGKSDQAAVRLERVDDPEPPPFHRSALYVARGDERQFAFRFHVQFVEGTDEHPVSARGNSDSNAAAGVLDRGELPFQPAHDGQLVERLEYPGLPLLGNSLNFEHPAPFGHAVRAHGLRQPGKRLAFDWGAVSDAGRSAFSRRISVIAG